MDCAAKAPARAKPVGIRRGIQDGGDLLRRCLHGIYDARLVYAAVQSERGQAS